MTICLGLELSSYLVYRTVFGEWFTYQQSAKEITAKVGVEPENILSQIDEGRLIPKRHFYPNPFWGTNFPSGLDEIEKSKSSTEFVIGITGGSVATEMYEYAVENQSEFPLQKLSFLSGKKIKLVLLGGHSFKQPQQVNVLNYYFLNGGRLDLLIALDGHNEISNAETNYQQKNHWTYPWLWPGLNTITFHPGYMDLIGRLSFVRKMRYENTQFFHHFKSSVTGVTFWKVLDRIFQTEEASIRHQMVSSSKYNRQVNGPQNPRLALNQRLQMFGSFWKASSKHIAALSQVYQFEYIHLLQPSQYVSKSKPFSPNELRVAFAEGITRTVVENGYRTLRRLGKELVSEGVSFFDLTAVFASETRSVYVDSCCHVNALGNQILWRAALQKVERLYQQKPRHASR